MSTGSTLLDLPDMPELINSLDRELHPSIDRSVAIAVFVNQAIDEAIARIEKDIGSQPVTLLTPNILVSLNYGPKVVNNHIKDNLEHYSRIYDELVNDIYCKLISYKIPMVFDPHLNKMVFPFRGNYLNGYLALQKLGYK